MNVRSKHKPASVRKAPARLGEIHAFGAAGAARARGGVQSIGRGFAIMEEIARNRDGIGLAELSKRVGLHNSTTFHLVKTMVSLGYVRQLKDTKRYRIGRPLFALAASALDEVEMMSLAAPVLDDLARATGESAHFSVPMGDAVVVLARTSGPGAFQLTDRVGVVRPAHCTALGKIMLAALPPAQFDGYLQRAELKVAHAEDDHLGRASGARDRRGAARLARRRRRRIRSRIALRGAAGARFQQPRDRRYRDFRPGLAVVDRGLAETRAPRARRRRPAVGGIRLCRRSASARHGGV